MIRMRDITQMCFSSNVEGIVANEIEQSFYSVYSYSRIESIKHALIFLLLLFHLQGQSFLLKLSKNLETIIIKLFVIKVLVQVTIRHNYTTSWRNSHAGDLITCHQQLVKKIMVVYL